MKWNRIKRSLFVQLNFIVLSKKKLTCHKTLTDVDEVAVSCLSCRTVADRRDLPKFSWCSVTLRALAFSVCTTSDILLALENPTNVSEWTTNTYAAAGFNSVIWKQRIMMMTNDKFYCFFHLNKTIQTLFWITAYLQLIILLIFELLLLKMNMMAFALAKHPIVIDLLSRFSHHYKFSFLFTSRGCGFQPEGQRKRLIQHVYLHRNLKYPKIIKLIWFCSYHHSSRRNSRGCSHPATLATDAEVRNSVSGWRRGRWSPRESDTILSDIYCLRSTWWGERGVWRFAFRGRSRYVNVRDHL